MSMHALIDILHLVYAAQRDGMGRVYNSLPTLTPGGAMGSDCQKGFRKQII